MKHRFLLYCKATIFFVQHQHKSKGLLKSLAFSVGLNNLNSRKKKSEDYWEQNNLVHNSYAINNQCNRPELRDYYERLKTQSP